MPFRHACGHGKNSKVNFMENPYLILESGTCDPALNMALDEALLLAAARFARPVLRFYGWTEPAATFGFFQPYEDIARWTRLRPLLRRPTGGGLVPHLSDWTYSLTFPFDHPWCRMRAAESYKRLHEWIRDAFAHLGMTTELCPQARKEIPGQCFAGAEQHDLLFQGRKLAGAAQRRNKHGLLIQGSVQPPPPGLHRTQWHQAMMAVGRDAQGISWQTCTPDDSLMTCAHELAASKYSQAAYNQKR